MTYRGGIFGAGSVRGPGPATWAVLGVLAATSPVAGCYKPNLVDGKLLCGPGNACPDGFGCVNGHCWLGGIVSPPDGGGDVPGVDLSEAEVPCAEPLCTPATPTEGCDPVCQTGCGCRQKCSISGAGDAVCVPIMGQQTLAQSCMISDYGFGSAIQDDTCAPGSVCLYPGGRGSSLPYCFALCASDDSCVNSRCVPRPVAPPPAPGIRAPTAKVCDVPFTPCDPLAASNNGCPADRPVCYLETPDPATGASRTVCEYFSGSLGFSASCDGSRDCFPRFVCPTNDGDAVRPGAGFCLAVCDSTHPCSLGSCQPYGSTYGYCVTN